MEIEKLSFIVTPPDRTQEFIKADTDIWTSWLQQQRGYLRKSYTEYPGGRVDVRIFWATKRDWDKATKDPQIPAVEVRMKAHFLGVYHLVK